MFLIVQQTEYFSTGDVRRKKDRQEAQTAAHVKLDADIFGGLNGLKLKIHHVHVCVCLQGKCTVCDGRDDLKEYSNIRSAMKVLQKRHQSAATLRL